MKSAQEFISEFNDIISFIAIDLQNILNRNQDAKERCKLYFNNLKSKIRLFNTENKLSNVFKNKNMGGDLEKVIVRRQDENPHYGTFFPITDMVRSFLELPNVLDVIQENQRESIRNGANGTISNIVNGELWAEVLNKK